MSETQPNEPDRFPDLAATYKAIIDGAPFRQFLWMTVLEVDAEAGRIVLYLPYRSDYQRMDGTGQIHGGPLASLIDIGINRRHVRRRRQGRPWRAHHEPAHRLSAAGDQHRTDGHRNRASGRQEYGHSGY